MMLQNPAVKYRPFQAVALHDREWPNQMIRKAPIWMSTDLRDGNQALIEPMSAEKKCRFFDLLVKIGFKEIEIGFPSASQTDFDFVRKLVEEQRIPPDVRVIVLTQAREALIRRTVESVVGCRSAIIHLYNSVAPVFRRVVFDMNEEQIIQIAVNGTQLVKELTAVHPETEWGFEYSPESFSSTELDFSKRIVDAVSQVWQPSQDRKMIVNLPATVESSTPNIFADQIEWMHRHLARRDCLVLSVHPHNDRGTAVAAAEFAIMAGADRVEGCLFGNGERTGNVDLVTLALNLYTQGVDPRLDFSDIDDIRQCAEACNQLPVHPRHPYAGDLVFTAFSGSHQDAIKKGLAKQLPDTFWEVPYLPIDPTDVGRNYDAVIRVNSQSGKGGIAFLLEQAYQLHLPRRFQIELSHAVQAHADATGKEMAAADIHAIFQHEYLDQTTPYTYCGHRCSEVSHRTEVVQIDLDLLLHGEPLSLQGAGNGPIDAFIDALGLNVRLIDYHEHAIGSGANAQAACYVALRLNDGPTQFGAAVDGSIVMASFKAVLSAINRQLAKLPTSVAAVQIPASSPILSLR